MPDCWSLYLGFFQYTVSLDFFNRCERRLRMVMKYLMNTDAMKISEPQTEGRTWQNIH